MSTKLYDGNLVNEISDSSLEVTFAGYGQVLSVSIVRDLETSRSRGFGFVMMSSLQEARAETCPLCDVPIQRFDEPPVEARRYPEVTAIPGRQLRHLVWVASTAALLSAGLRS